MKSTRDLRESQSLGDGVVLKMKMEVSRRKKDKLVFQYFLGFM